MLIRIKLRWMFRNGRKVYTLFFKFADVLEGAAGTAGMQLYR